MGRATEDGISETGIASSHHAPSVTVFTNFAGAVAVTVDRDSIISAGRRLSTKPLPENLFNPFRKSRSRRQAEPTPLAEKQRAGDVEDAAAENLHVNSAAAAAIAVEGIKTEVRHALDRWALQTSKRESMALWRHECSRYGSSSRIGYHPNHPSSSHPSSRPSSAATILRPFSAGRVLQQTLKQKQEQRASSALPRFSKSLGNGVGTGGVDWNAHNSGETSGLSSTTREGGGRGRRNRTRPRSAITRLGEDKEMDGDDAGRLAVGPRPARGVRASASRGELGGGDLLKGGNLSTIRREGATSANRARSPMNYQPGGCFAGDEELGEDETFDDIYEDLDDEDDGELDNRISIMENRFSTVGREGPDSAAGGGSSGAIDVEGLFGAQRRRTAMSATPRSVAGQRPPLVPPNHFQGQQQQQLLVPTSAGPQRMPRHRPDLPAGADRPTATDEAGRNGAAGTQHTRLLLPYTAATRGTTQPIRVMRMRPTSAPADRDSLLRRRQPGGRVAVGGGAYDPMAPLRARRLRLQMLSADRERGFAAGAQDGGERVEVRDGERQRWRPVRDVTTAVPFWNRSVHGGGGRPLSSATEGATTATAPGTTTVGFPPDIPRQMSSETAPTSANSYRPSSAAFRSWVEARPSARSAVSAVSSARTLGMDDAELVHLQLEMESRRGVLSQAALARVEDHYTAVFLKNSSSGEPSRPRHRPVGSGKRGRPASPLKRSGRGKSPRKRGGSKGSRGGKKSRSKSPSKGRKPKGRKKGVTRKGGSNGGRRGLGGSGGGGGGGPTTKAKKVYASAGEFMAEHFPPEEQHGLSLLGLEQEEECRQASEALSRAGVSCSTSILRRALVIPTDRPIEICLAGLPVPSEGLRSAPFPVPPPPPPPPPLLSPVAAASRGKTVGVVVGAAIGLSKVGARNNKKPLPRGGSGAGARGKSPVGGGRLRRLNGLQR